MLIHPSLDPDADQYSSRPMAGVWINIEEVPRTMRMLLTLLATVAVTLSLSMPMMAEHGKKHKKEAKSSVDKKERKGAQQDAKKKSASKEAKEGKVTEPEKEQPVKGRLGGESPH